VPKPTGALKEALPDASAVASELERIAASKSFRKAERCLRLLRYLTSSVLDGRGDELKEYSVGLAVFDRPDSYDPGTDPIVRLEARRLRLKLAEYYQQEGIGDPVIIDIPKGAYVPAFQFRRLPETEVEREPMPEPEAAPPRGTHRILWIAVGAVTLLILVFAASWSVFAKRPPVMQMRASVAVMGFQDLSPHNEGSWVSTAVSELMNIDLGAGQQLRALPLENVARTQKELALPPQSSYPAQVLQRIRMDLGSDYVVGGSYLPQGHVIHLNVVLFDAQSGRQVAAISEQGAEDNLPALIERCSQRVQAQLGMRYSTTGTSSFEDSAMEPYARGMEQLRNGDAQSARVYLEQAAAAAPGNPLVHAGLAAAWSALGMDIRAGQEAKLAFDSSAGLGRVEQLEIEGRYRAVTQDWPRAIEVYQALFTLLPDDPEYGLLLASAQTTGGRGQDALSTVKALRRLPLPAGDDPRIDLAEARAAGALSDFERTRKMAHAAGEKAKAHGARLQYARARLLESGAMQNLRVAGFADVRAEARQICAELGDLACVAAAYRIEANASLGYGNIAGARVLYESALGIANQIGNALEKLNAVNGMADAAKLQGDLNAAESSYKTALTVSSEMGPQKSYSIMLGLAEVLAEEGRLPEARKLSENALQIVRQTGELQGIGLGQADVANTLALGGKSADAVAMYGEAIAKLREVNDLYYLGQVLLDAGNAQLDEGNLAEARKNFEEVRTLARRFPDWRASEVDMAFARLAFAEGHAADAVSSARLALNGFTASGRQGDRFEAAAVLVRALIAQHEIAQASQALAQLPSPQGQKLPARNIVPFQIARCFLLANTGKREEALREIDAVSASAARSGLPILAKEAQQAKKALVKGAG
jgi:tetratricopeptide (TPR) repeat protein